jgi:hypothetical protein
MNQSTQHNLFRKLNTIAILYMLERMTADNVLKRFESLMRAAMINLDP